jgi:diguanylate cyclase (GGDEF)-like protein
MLDALANQAALALARVQLYQDVARAALEMSSLYRIGLATSSSLEIDEVLMQIYRQVQDILAPDAFFIALIDPETDAIRFELIAERGKLLPWKGVPPGTHSLTEWVARNRRSLLIRHAAVEQDELPARIVTDLDMQSILILPLIAKDKVIGTISVQKLEPYAFDEESLRVMAAIAAQAALALENARLHSEMQARALRDSLTGAYNHATLIARLEAAIAAAQPQHQSLALIMLDVDHFKEFNDKLGHQAGDAALRALVQAIQASTKAGDTVGRWGGEEFAVVLPGATPDDAVRVAERIRDRLANLALTGPRGERWPNPTVSQGVATFPADAASAPILVDVADRALYQAKALGRNQIVLAGRRAALDTAPADGVR